MGVFDQAARFAARADPEPVARRLLAGKGATWRFRQWLDTRTIPLPGGSDRTADLVAVFDDGDGQAWLMVLEFQAQHDAYKLDVTLEEAGVMRNRVRDGEARFKVMVGLVYLKGKCPEEVLDMTLVGGFGTRHAPLIWNVGEDDAGAAVEEVASGRMSWGLLFWVALMKGGGNAALIARWKEVVAEKVADKRERGNVAAVALVFAELAGRVPEWKRGLEGLEMTESQVVNEWMSETRMKENLKARRQYILRLIQGKFSDPVPQEIAQLIGQQDSLAMLDTWFDAAIAAASLQDFIAVLRR